MPEYRVEWAIDVTADDALGAANVAWAIMHDSAATATVFEVADEHDRTTHVDLADDSVGSTVWMPTPEAIAQLAEWMSNEAWDLDEIIEMIRRPHKYADEYTRMITEREYDKVAMEPEAEDTEPSSDEERELMK
jgi:hypothetical protein